MQHSASTTLIIDTHLPRVIIMQITLSVVILNVVILITMAPLNKPKQLEIDKHSSLFCHKVSDEEESFCIADTCTQYYKTFYGRNLRTFIIS
jgi:hypothetical protein